MSLTRKRQGFSKDEENPNKRTHKELSGICLCGSIEFILKRTKPLQSFYCHCTHCRMGREYPHLISIGHGAPYAILSTVLDEEIFISKGEEKLNRFVATPYLSRYNCKICGTFIVAEV